MAAPEGWHEGTWKIRVVSPRLEQGVSEPGVGTVGSRQGPRVQVDSDAGSV
jgi:hypothetical protein